MAAVQSVQVGNDVSAPNADRVAALPVVKTSTSTIDSTMGTTDSANSASGSKASPFSRTTVTGPMSTAREKAKNAQPFKKFIDGLKRRLDKVQYEDSAPATNEAKKNSSVAPEPNAFQKLLKEDLERINPAYGKYAERLTRNGYILSEELAYASPQILKRLGIPEDAATDMVHKKRDAAKTVIVRPSHATGDASFRNHQAILKELQGSIFTVTNIENQATDTKKELEGAVEAKNEVKSKEEENADEQKDKVGEEKENSVEPEEGHKVKAKDTKENDKKPEDKKDDQTAEEKKDEQIEARTEQNNDEAPKVSLEARLKDTTYLGQILGIPATIKFATSPEEKARLQNEQIVYKALQDKQGSVIPLFLANGTASEREWAAIEALPSVSFEWSKHADLSDQVLSALKKLHADKVSLPNFDPEHNVRVTLRKDPANPDKDIKEIRLVHLDEAVLNASEETLKAEEDAFTLLQKTTPKDNKLSKVSNTVGMNQLRPLLKSLKKLLRKWVPRHSA